MTETDAFFTHSIVGAPQSLSLGRRLHSEDAKRQGLKVHLERGDTGLSKAWREWVVLSHATDPVGQPRLRPGRMRGLMERHALVIATLGLAGLMASAVTMGILFWK